MSPEITIKSDSLKKCIFFLFVFSLCGILSVHSETTDKDRYNNTIYQWETDLNSVPEKDASNKRRAFLWIPPKCQQLRGLIVSGHNALEEGLLEDSLFRAAMTELNFGELWVTPDFEPSGVFDASKGAQTSFMEAINELAEESGYEELKYVPVVYISHSAQASSPWNFGAWNPEKALALISFHGDSPRSTYLCCNHHNPDWGNRHIDGIPGLICIGSDEWTEFRVEDSFRFMKQYPNSVISLLCNAGRGHGDFSQEDLKYLIRFIQKAVQHRMPVTWDGKNQMVLKRIDRKNGWLADRWHRNSLPAAGTSPFAGYGGNRDSAYWYFDEEMARWTESIYERQRNKKKQYLTMMQNGRILKKEERLAFITDGKSFEINAKAVFTDSTYKRLSEAHTIEPIRLKRYSGPVQIVNDTTFRINFYRPGVLHKRATNIGLFAFAESDYLYGHAVCHFSWKMEKQLKEGKKQSIVFPKVENVPCNAVCVKLKAKSNCNLPVQYYVRSGPAYIDKGTLYISEIPVKAKYPIKITVVAWQYGSMVDPKVQTAQAVEQSLYIINTCQQ